MFYAEEASRAAQSKLNEFQIRSRKTNEAADRLLGIVERRAEVEYSLQHARKAHRGTRRPDRGQSEK